MIQIIQIRGKDQYLYLLLGPSVMDPEVLRANNNYPFKTDESFVWFVATEGENVIGFVPVERKSKRNATINNYYIGKEKEGREEVLSCLLAAVVNAFGPEEWLLSSVTLIQDKETFEKSGFTFVDKKWTRYVKMRR